MVLWRRFEEILEEGFEERFEETMVSWRRFEEGFEERDLRKKI